MNTSDFLDQLMGDYRAPNPGTPIRVLQEVEDAVSKWRNAAVAVEYAAIRIAEVVDRIAKETPDAG